MVFLSSPSLKTYLQLLSELQLEMIAQLFPTLSEINKDNKDTQTFSLYKHLYFDLLWLSELLSYWRVVRLLQTYI